jgi:hypothetical protein
MVDPGHRHVGDHHVAFDVRRTVRPGRCCSAPARWRARLRPRRTAWTPAGCGSAPIVQGRPASAGSPPVVSGPSCGSAGGAGPGSGAPRAASCPDK